VIVLDASAAFEWLLETPTGARIDERIFSRAESLHAPHLIDVEVAQVLRRYAAMGAVTPARARGALQDLIDLPLIRYPHDLLLPRIWKLRENFTAYDAAYLALAEALGARLVTCDRKIASVSLHYARVEVI
jgi:predicted nucleic acid-binding protein